MLAKLIRWLLPIHDPHPERMVCEGPHCEHDHDEARQLEAIERRLQQVDEMLRRKEQDQPR